jgi:flagellar assembly protein FliH
MTTIIKADNTDWLESGSNIQAVPFHFGEMTEQAEQYVEQIRKQARQIVEASAEQAAALRRKAEEEGRRAAMASVRDAVQIRVEAEAKSVTDALHGLVAAIETARHEWTHHWQRAAVNLSAAIAGRIVRRQLDHDPEIPLRLIQEALEMAVGCPEITVRLNPGDHQLLGPQVDQLAQPFRRLAACQIFADPSITPGGCKVETRFGVIDQQLETQLDRIAQELT